MAEIVLGIGTSHSPLLTFDAATWVERGDDDRRNPALALSDGRTLPYDELLREREGAYADQATLPRLEEAAARTGPALDRLAAALREARPDVVLVIGDDQEELYKAGNMPALGVYYGEEIVMRPLGELMNDPPNWLQRAVTGYAMETAHRFRGAPEFGEMLIEGLIEAGVDVAAVSSVPDPKVAAFGHAYGFVARRLLDEGSVPIVPILLNTYYPPNVIRPARCYQIGKHIHEAIEAMPRDWRVAIVASGGLSHFVTDAELDRKVLDALAAHDEATLCALPMDALRTGSSEILCWIMAGGALRHLSQEWSEYVPVYRTEAGTGIGLAFAIWR